MPVDMNMTIPARVNTEADADLFRAVQAGDAAALQTLMARQERWIRAVVLAVLGRSDRVDDVAQRVWTTVWRRAGTLRDPAKWRSWLGRLARNLAIDAGREATRRRNQRSVGDEILDARPGTSPSPVDELALTEQQRLVLGAIQGLPAIYREPFVLRHVEGWTYRQIGEHLEMPVDTVETRLVRARRLLREALQGKV